VALLPLSAGNHYAVSTLLYLRFALGYAAGSRDEDYFPQLRRPMRLQAPVPLTKKCRLKNNQ
jgi:hypothetical protein